MMKKSHLILFVGGGLIAIGMALLGISSTAIENDVIKTDGVVKAGSPLELTAELDPQIGNGEGYFVVLSREYKNAELSAMVFDPAGNHVTISFDSVGNDIKILKIDQEATQQKFKLENKGHYKLVLESKSSTEITAIIGLSYYPKLLEVLAILGGYMILAGFGGVIIAIIYSIINRKKPS